MTGKDLKIIRLLHGFDTQKSLAVFIGMSTRTVVYHETSELLSPKVIKKYADKGLNIKDYYGIKEKFRRDLRTNYSTS